MKALNTTDVCSKAIDSKSDRDVVMKPEFGKNMEIGNICNMWRGMHICHEF